MRVSRSATSTEGAPARAKDAQGRPAPFTAGVTPAALPPTPPLPPTPRRIVEFAEKPKGDALKRMQVDTTILGLDAET